jgi:sortase A
MPATAQAMSALTPRAERGGPFGRGDDAARASMRAAATGTAFRFPAAESSPLGIGRRRLRLRALVLVVVALVGAALFGNGAWLYTKAALGQWLLQRAWSEARASGAAVKPWPWADTHPVARLIVPAADADELVLAGASGRTLAWGPGHLDDSAPLGGSGNAVVSAHRDTHFRFVRTLADNDEIIVELPDGVRRHYRVRDRYVADVAMLKLPRTTIVPTLTLVTCYPFDALLPGGPLRYVVVAEAA